MLGAIIGDIVGSRFEFNNIRSKQFRFFSKDCFFTDDSLMTLAVANAISDSAGNLENLGALTVNYMRELGRQYPNAGYGGLFARWLTSEKPEPYNSFGNGAAMRVSPCGLAARSEEEAKLLSKLVTEVTHNHPEGIKGAEAVSIAIYLAKNGATKPEIRERIEKDYYPLDFTLNGIRETYEFSGTCQETVPQAIVAFLESASFEDAIRNAVSIGGDSDTLAAIAGAIASAYYEVPDSYENDAMKYLDARLRQIYKAWKKFIKSIYDPQKLYTLTKFTGKLNTDTLQSNFEDEFFLFMKYHNEIQWDIYKQILEKNGLEWSERSFQNAQVNSLGEDVVFALLTGVFAADHITLGVLDAYCQNGVISNWLARLKKIDQERIITPDFPEVITLKIKISNEEHTETFEINQDQISIHQQIQDTGEINHQYLLNSSVLTDIRDRILAQTRKALASTDWQDVDTEISNRTEDSRISQGNKFRYALSALRDDETVIEHSGLYDRAHLPDKPWQKWIEEIQALFDRFALCEVVNSRLFMGAIKPGEVKYCGVEFSGEGQIYHYRTTDLSISSGDRVIVPAGRENYHREATVRTVEFCRWDNTPYPLEKTKVILHKVDETAALGNVKLLPAVINLKDHSEDRFEDYLHDSQYREDHGLLDGDFIGPDEDD
jgi:ADP-ribosyl-[dinitrogen reductase] hydrolase